MKKPIDKKKATTISFVLLLITVLFTACISATMAQKFSSVAYLYFRPNPIGTGQSLLVNAWITPRPPGGWFGTEGDVYYDYTFVFTKPDGTTDTVVMPESYRDGTTWFEYIPDQVGNWDIQFTWAGDADHEAASTDKQQLVVQTDPVPSWPPAPLPTEPWDWPVNPNNREWATITGAYLQPTTGNGLGYDSTGGRFNPYCQAPNSAHVLWKLPPVSGMGGLVGGQYGELLTFNSAGSESINVVMAGRGYYSTGGKIYCVDIRTGEQLWVADGGYAFGTLTDTYMGPTRIISIAEYPGELTTTFSPQLVSIGGSRFVKYDGLTGNVLLDIEGIPGTFVGYDGQYAYVVQRDPDAPFYQGSPDAWVDPATYFLYKVDTGGTETDITKRIIYKVEYPFNTVDIGVCLYNNILSLIHFPLYGESGAIDTATGEVLWHRPIGGAEGFIEQKPESVTSGDGIMYFAVQNREFTAVDMATGDVLWYSEKTDYPWGNFWAYGQSVAYGNVYALGYAGVYSFDTSTGKINWHYSSGNSGYETPYGTWPFGSADPVVADGKVYAPSTEHSPTFYYRGEKLHCIDAYTGDAIWTILGNYRVDAVAEGCLFASNAYDRNKYCFGKGETVTSISVSDEVISKGSSVLLKGSVLDMSPAQPGTAAISDASMSEWMEYLHMQQPCPADVKGVEVTLDTIDPNGNFVHIGTVTSDMSGMFRHLWTPEIEGAYTVIATFEGSESYYASYAETAIGVGPSVSAGGPIEPEPSEPMITTEVALIATAVIVAIAAIAGIWIISRRK